MDNKTRIQYERWKKRKIRRIISLIVLFFVTVIISFWIVRFFNRSVSQTPDAQPPIEDPLVDEGSDHGEDDDLTDYYDNISSEIEIEPREPIVFCGLADPEGAGVLTNEEALDYLALVNRCQRLRSDFSPLDLRFVNVPQVNTWSGNHYLRESAATALENLFSEAAEQGLDLVLSSAYRDYNLQSVFFNNNVNNLGRDQALRVSAVPGHSEHQLGLGADISTPALESVGWLTNTFSTTPEGIWVGQNAHRFGFIISYPYGRTEDTGFIYEPWHLRYIGIYAATSIYEQGLILEEFLWYYN